MSISREERLGRLESFVSDSRKTLSSLVTQLGWSIESVTKNVSTNYYLQMQALKNFKD